MRGAGWMCRLEMDLVRDERVGMMEGTNLFAGG